MNKRKWLAIGTFCFLTVFLCLSVALAKSFEPTPAQSEGAPSLNSAMDPEPTIYSYTLEREEIPFEIDDREIVYWRGESYLRHSARGYENIPSSHQFHKREEFAAVPNATIAITIAEAMFCAFIGEENMEDFEIRYILEDPVYGAWEITFCSKITYGVDYRICLQKADGKLIGIFPG